MDTFIFKQLARKIIQFTTGSYLEANISEQTNSNKFLPTAMHL